MANLNPVKVISLYKNEAQLIARAAKNHRDAQQQLYKRFSGKMLSVCRMYIKDLHYAEEAMLNGFLKVFTHLKDFKGEGSFEGWIRRIMIRESISLLRKAKDFEYSVTLVEDSGECINDFQSEMDAEHIQQLIDELPEGYRVIFVMYAIEGYKHREISKILNISIGTSKSQLFKARKLLQEKLELQNIEGYGTK